MGKALVMLQKLQLIICIVCAELNICSYLNGEESHQKHVILQKQNKEGSYSTNPFNFSSYIFRVYSSLLEMHETHPTFCNTILSFTDQKMGFLLSVEKTVKGKQDVVWSCA